MNAYEFIWNLESLTAILSTEALAKVEAGRQALATADGIWN
jgi:hypothetical protein